MSDVIGWMLVAAASVVGIAALAVGRRLVLPATSRGEPILPRTEGWSVVLVVDSCLIAVTGFVFVGL